MPVRVADVLFVASTGPVVEFGALAELDVRGRGPLEPVAVSTTLSLPTSTDELPEALDKLITLGDKGDDVLGESLFERAALPLTGAVTVVAELEGQPRSSSAANCALASVIAASSLDTVLRAACSVDALVGRAVASAFASAILAMATWASATWAVDCAALIAAAVVPVGTATM
jgi:hypothetical protein